MMYLGNDPVGLATSLPVFSDKVQIETGIYIPNDDIKSVDNPVTIFHNLGTIPDFILFQAFGLTINNSYDKKYALCYSFQKIDNDYISILTKSLVPGQITAQSNNMWVTLAILANNDVISDSFFKVMTQGSDSYFKKDIPYYYIVGKFKEVTSNANE